MAPTLSIVVPAHNVGGYIKKCLESIQSQSFKDFEVLIVDDCSIDNTVDLAKRICLADSRFKLLQTSCNSGSAAKPKNLGLQHASGRYIAFVDSDDWIDTDMFSNLVEKSSQVNAEIVSCEKFKIWSEEMLSYKTIEFRYPTLSSSTKDRRVFLTSPYLSNVCNRIYKLEFLKDNKILFPEIYYSEDFAFSCMAHMFANTTTAVEGGGYNYRYSRAGSTTRARSSIKGFRCIYQFNSFIKYLSAHPEWNFYEKEVLRRYLKSIQYAYEKLDNSELQQAFKELFTISWNPFLDKLDPIGFSSEQKRIFSSLYLSELKNERFFKLHQQVTFKKAHQHLIEGNEEEAKDIYNIIKIYNPFLAKYAEQNLARIDKKNSISNMDSNESGELQVKNKEYFLNDTKNNTYDNPLSLQSVVRRTYTIPNSKSRIKHGGLRLNQRRYLKKDRDCNFPLVSIVTTVRNGGLYIEAAIRSVINQTYKNIEYIIVDSASDDDTISIIEKFGDKIDYFVSEKDNGIYEGMNKGIQLASGKYIIILNSDDVFLKDAIEVLVHEAEQKSSDIVLGSVELVDANNNCITKMNSSWNIGFYYRCPARHGAMLVNAKAYNRIGLYNTNYKVIADQEWMLRAYKNNLSAAIINNVIMRFRNTGISSTSNSIHLKEVENSIRSIAPSINSSDISLLQTSWKLSGEEICNLILKYTQEPVLRQSLSSRWRESIIGTDKPLVSIQVPIYNAADYLEECLESIASQSFLNYEVICVDDCSTDSSLEIAYKYARQDPRFHVITMNENMGALYCRKMCMNFADGEYMIFVDADDVLEPDSLKDMYSFVNSNGYDFAQFCADIYDPLALLDPEILNGYRKSYIQTEELVLEGENVFNALCSIVKTNFWISIVRKDIYKKVASFIPDIRLPHGNDNLIMFMIAYFSNDFATSNIIVYKYRANPQSSNLNSISLEKAIDHILSRSQALKYSIDFLKSVDSTYSVEWLPIKTFRYSTAGYCKKLVERAILAFPCQELNLIRLFRQNFPWYSWTR